MILRSILLIISIFTSVIILLLSIYLCCISSPNRQNTLSACFFEGITAFSSGKNLIFMQKYVKKTNYTSR